MASHTFAMSRLLLGLLASAWLCPIVSALEYQFCDQAFGTNINTVDVENASEGQPRNINTYSVVLPASKVGQMVFESDSKLVEIGLALYSHYPGPLPPQATAEFDVGQLHTAIAWIEQTCVKANGTGGFSTLNLDLVPANGQDKFSANTHYVGVSVSSTGAVKIGHGDIENRIIAYIAQQKASPSTAAGLSEPAAEPGTCPWNPSDSLYSSDPSCSNPLAGGPAPSNSSTAPLQSDANPSATSGSDPSSTELPCDSSPVAEGVENELVAQLPAEDQELILSRTASVLLTSGEYAIRIWSDTVTAVSVTSVVIRRALQILYSYCTHTMSRSLGTVLEYAQSAVPIIIAANMLGYDVRAGARLLHVEVRAMVMNNQWARQNNIVGYTLRFAGAAGQTIQVVIMMGLRPALAKLRKWNRYGFTGRGQTIGGAAAGAAGAVGNAVGEAASSQPNQFASAREAAAAAAEARQRNGP